MRATTGVVALALTFGPALAGRVPGPLDLGADVDAADSALDDGSTTSTVTDSAQPLDSQPDSELTDTASTLDDSAPDTVDGEETSHEDAGTVTDTEVETLLADTLVGDTGPGDTAVLDDTTAIEDTQVATDAPPTDAASGDTEIIETNACGGVGTVGPGQPGDPCGPCLDGEWICNPDDAAGRTTRCEGASAVDACGGCGLAFPLGDACGDCGTYGCDPDGGCRMSRARRRLSHHSGLRGPHMRARQPGVYRRATGSRTRVFAATAWRHILVGGACVPRLFARLA